MNFKEGTPPLDNLIGERVYPYIVACGKNAKSVSEFYIVVEQQLIQVIENHTNVTKIRDTNP